MQRVVPCCLPDVSCGYKCGADLPGVTKQPLCLGVYVVLLVSLLLVGCYRRSHARKPDSYVAGGDPFPLMLIRFLGDYYDRVTQVVRVVEIHAQPFADSRMRLRTVSMQKFSRR